MENELPTGRKLPLSIKIIQGTGSIPEVVKGYAFGTLLLFYYNQVLGVSGTLCGWALGIAMCFDAVSDPMVGSASDNFRSKLGRRHPFMYASAIPLGIFIYFLFTPPNGFTELKLFIWLISFAVLTRLVLTFYVVPYHATVAEYSQDYYERTQVMSYRVVFAWISALCTGFFTMRFLFPTTPEFTPGHLNPAGYPVFAAIASIAIVVMIFFTTHFTRKEIPFLPKPPKEKQPFSLMNVLREVRMALSNRNFRLVFISVLLFGAIGGTVSTLGIYMQTYFWGLFPEQMAWYALAVFGAATAFVILKPIQKRFDKKTIIVAALIFSILDGITMINLRFLDILPENGDPLLIKILVANAMLTTCIMTVSGIVSPSIMADIVDEQELVTGLRQEGIFFSAISFSGKAISSFGVILGGLIIDLLAFPTGADPRTLDPQIITRLGVIVGIVLPLFNLIPVGLLSQYQLTRERHEEIRIQLLQKRAQRMEAAV